MHPHRPTPSLVATLRSDVDAICLPKGRKVGSPGHRAVRERLSRRLQEIGCQPWRGTAFDLPYASGVASFHNVVGVIRGRNPQLAPLLIGAHYDSAIAAPCADDNAAAVAIALAVGEQMSDSRALERDLIVALFDAEEPPFFQSPAMGSRRFWEDQRDGRAFHAAIIMDLVGHDVRFHDAPVPLPIGVTSSAAPLLFVTGTESHPRLRSAFKRAGTVDHLSLVPTLNAYVGDMSDHGVFRENGVPYFFLSCGRWEHYHEPTDTPDRLNYDKMERIVRQVLAFAHALDETELPQTGSEQFSHTLDLEVSGLRMAFGLSWKLLLELCGLRAIDTRSDMNHLVATLLAAGI